MYYSLYVTKNQKKVSTDNEGVNRVLGYSHTTYAPPLLKLIPEFKVYSNQGAFYLAEKYGKMMLDGFWRLCRFYHMTILQWLPLILAVSSSER